MGKWEWVGLAGGLMAIGAGVLEIIRRVWFAPLDVKFQRLDDWRENHDEKVVPGIISDFEGSLNGYGKRVEEINSSCTSNTTDIRAIEKQLTEVRGRLEVAASERGRLVGDVNDAKAVANAAAIESRGNIQALVAQVNRLEGAFEEVRRMAFERRGST